MTHTSRAKARSVKTSTQQQRYQVLELAAKALITSRASSEDQAKFHFPRNASELDSFWAEQLKLRPKSIQDWRIGRRNCPPETLEVIRKLLGSYAEHLTLSILEASREQKGEQNVVSQEKTS